MPEHEKIDYLELPARDFSASKAFFTAVFGWGFEDYGTEYTAFLGAGIDGGFYASDLVADASKGSALAIFYSADLESTLAKVQAAGGNISQEIFSFPGGRRFHFIEPSGNEFAVWSDLGL